MVLVVLSGKNMFTRLTAGPARRKVKTDEAVNAVTFAGDNLLAPLFLINRAPMNRTLLIGLLLIGSLLIGPPLIGRLLMGPYS